MISNIRLRNFRSYRDGSFEFEPGVNIVVGPNASGKTNLLEAVLVMATGGSYRSRDTNLVRFGTNGAYLDSIFDASPRKLKIIKEDEQLDKTYEINGQSYKRLSHERTLPVVLFEPNSLLLIIRGPERRRDYFDDVLERTLPGFRKLSGQYRRALAQRNSLLKQGATRASKQLFAWDVRLSELGAQIAGARHALINTMNQSTSKTYSQISGKRSSLQLIYESPLPANNYSTAMLSKLEGNLELDLARGFTGSGPHREDVSFVLRKKPAGISASRGEIRSIVLTLKIIELELIEKARGFKPIFLLDDVFSELDSARRQHLVKYLKDYQSLITTTDADSVIEYFDTHNLISTQTT